LDQIDTNKKIGTVTYFDSGKFEVVNDSTVLGRPVVLCAEGDFSGEFSKSRSPFGGITLQLFLASLTRGALQNGPVPEGESLWRKLAFRKELAEVADPALDGTPSWLKQNLCPRSLPLRRQGAGIRLILLSSLKEFRANSCQFVAKKNP